MDRSVFRVVRGDALRARRNGALAWQSKQLAKPANARRSSGAAHRWECILLKEWALLLGRTTSPQVAQRFSHEAGARLQRWQTAVVHHDASRVFSQWAACSHCACRPQQRQLMTSALSFPSRHCHAIGAPLVFGRFCRWPVCLRCRSLCPLGHRRARSTRVVYGRCTLLTSSRLSRKVRGPRACAVRSATRYSKFGSGPATARLERFRPWCLVSPVPQDFLVELHRRLVGTLSDDSQKPFSTVLGRIDTSVVVPAASVGGMTHEFRGHISVGSTAMGESPVAPWLQECSAHLKTGNAGAS